MSRTSDLVDAASRFSASAAERVLADLARVRRLFRSKKLKTTIRSGQEEASPSVVSVAAHAIASAVQWLFPDYTGIRGGFRWKNPPSSRGRRALRSTRLRRLGFERLEARAMLTTYVWAGPNNGAAVWDNDVNSDWTIQGRTGDFPFQSGNIAEFPAGFHGTIEINSQTVNGAVYASQVILESNVSCTFVSYSTTGSELLIPSSVGTSISVPAGSSADFSLPVVSQDSTATIETIGSGMVEIAAGATVNLASLTVGQGAMDAGTLNVQGTLNLAANAGGLTVQDDTTLSGGGTINLAANAPLTYASGAASTFAGTISGPADIDMPTGATNSLTLTGHVTVAEIQVQAGTLALNGSASATSMTVNAATVRIGSFGNVAIGGAAANAPVLVSAAATLDVQGTLNVTASSTTTASALTVTGSTCDVEASGTLSVNGGTSAMPPAPEFEVNGFGGGLEVAGTVNLAANGGGLAVNDSATLSGGGAINLAAGAPLTYASSAASSFTGTISGPAEIVVSMPTGSSNSLTLTGNVQVAGIQEQTGALVLDGSATARCNWTALRAHTRAGPRQRRQVAY